MSPGPNRAPPGTTKPQGCAYEAALRPLLFECGAPFETHRYLAESGSGGSHSRRAKRVMVEAPDLSTSLPLSLSSSVCVRLDSSRMHLWKALITGPDDTPYGGGCFVFDFFLPGDYPHVPPKVLLTTTGGGSVRFNPNLYADGKVRRASSRGGQAEGSMGGAPDPTARQRACRPLLLRPDSLPCPPPLAAGVPLAAGHVAGRRGRELARGHVDCAAGGAKRTRRAAPAGPPLTEGGSARLRPLCSADLSAPPPPVRAPPPSAVRRVLRQVLMSIQALILVSHPYYNEPGYEHQVGDRASTQYSQKIREATIRHAMIGQLRTPPAEFADVVRAHFRLKRRQIRQQCAQWIADAGSDTSHRGALSRLTSELEVELDKLG